MRSNRPAYALALFIVGVCTLAAVGAYVVTAAVWGWLT